MNILMALFSDILPKAFLLLLRAGTDLNRINVIAPETLFSFFILDEKSVRALSRRYPIITDNNPNNSRAGKRIAQLTPGIASLEKTPSSPRTVPSL
ncbi:MAG: hypothetical protein V3U06_10550 [Candidatus Binatia bacterium]